MTDRKITTGGKERISAAADVLSEAFRTDPVITYLLSSLSTPQHLAYLPKYFTALVTAAALNHASINEIDDWKSCGILIPPDCRVDNPLTLLPAGFLSVLWTIGVGGCQRMLYEFPSLSNACKAKTLQPDEKYCYVFFVGTHDEHRGNGLCSALLRHYQATAAKEGFAIWMEATTEYSWKLYERLGFETVGDFVIGRGVAGSDGMKQEGGEGVRLWGMVWRKGIEG